ncbi:MAG: hypothetical protein OIF51_04250 [Cellvibrionaceae bacterium]|nr:hypothetical protein [Cellvibrionaceae bacterium]
MKLRVTALAVIVLIGFVSLGAFSGIITVTWDGACGYKEEHGMITFYRTGAGDGPETECRNGVVFPGILILALLMGCYVISIITSWYFLIKKHGQKSNT